ncbi:MAG: hypothetical protein ABI963_13335 [Rhizomicrobium sp.]
MSERLLTAGIAPRHVHRYVRELSDHFDDLMQEEMAGGASRALAETKALSRLGHDDALAEAMLSRPELRSLTARFPWAVFGFGPAAMLTLSVVAALQIEIWLIEFATAWGPAIGLHPGPAAARGFTFAMLVWNTFAVYGAPLGFAALLYLIGSRQRMRTAWIVTGVAIICVLGGFQNLVFYDTGVRGGGVLLIQSGLISPFWHFVDDGFFSPFNFAEGLARAAMNLAVVGGVWLTARKKASTAIGLHTART